LKENRTFNQGWRLDYTHRITTTRLNRILSRYNPFITYGIVEARTSSAALIINSRATRNMFWNFGEYNGKLFIDILREFSADAVNSVKEDSVVRVFEDGKRETIARKQSVHLWKERMNPKLLPNLGKGDTVVWGSAKEDETDNVFFWKKDIFYWNYWMKALTDMKRIFVEERMKLDEEERMKY